MTLPDHASPAYPACTPPAASDHVALNGNTLGIPNAVRSPLSARSAERICSALARPTKTRFNGSSRVSPFGVSQGDRLRLSDPTATLTSPDGAGACAPVELRNTPCDAALESGGSFDSHAERLHNARAAIRNAA